MRLISTLLDQLSDDVDMALIEGRLIHPRDLRPLITEIRELYRREGFSAPLADDDPRTQPQKEQP